MLLINEMKSASVAQLDARPSGDQEVAGLILAGPGSILSWRFDQTNNLSVIKVGD